MYITNSFNFWGEFYSVSCSVMECVFTARELAVSSSIVGAVVTFIVPEVASLSLRCPFYFFAWFC